MAPGSGICLVGNSVRALARSGWNHGRAVLGVDAFNDDDMRLACTRTAEAQTIGAAALAAALPDAWLDSGLPWSYTAGFEQQPEVLDVLRRRNSRLLGNDPAVLRAMRDARRWFSLLGELEIGTPQTQFDPPVMRDGWLVKRTGSAGGLGVRRALPGEEPEADVYYQTFVRGDVCSLTFAADGKNVVPIGFSRLAARYPSAGDFRFSSVISGYRPTSGQSGDMLNAAWRLTRTLGLRGVNGLDFVMHAGRALLLELNPRPPASLELYESVLPGGGLSCHLAACQGQLPERVDAACARGLRVLYADRPLLIGAVDWPDVVRDRPRRGTRLDSDQPVCTVHVEGPDATTIAARLREASDLVHATLHPFTEEAA